MASERAMRWAGAIVVVLGFGMLLLGRVMMYPCAVAPGTMLERIGATGQAWDCSHRVMTAGFVLLIPAAMALWGSLRERSPVLSFAGAWLLALAAALSVGQFALDLAYLVAARVLPAEGAQAFVDGVLAHPFVRVAFYKLPELGGYGVALLALAMFRNGRAWWPAGAVVALAVVSSVVDAQMGPVGPRVTLGVQFAGFALAAWRIAWGRPRGAFEGGSYECQSRRHGQVKPARGPG
jgi:hypothetical protein